MVEKTHEFPLNFSPVKPPKHVAALDTSDFVYPSLAQAVDKFQVNPLCQGGLEAQFWHSWTQANSFFSPHDRLSTTWCVMQPSPSEMGVEGLLMDSPVLMEMEGQSMDSLLEMGVGGKCYLFLSA